MKTLEQVQRVNQLLAITGNNYSEIIEPDSNWLAMHKRRIGAHNDEYGKFFIREDAIIDYMSKGYSIFDLKHYDASLLTLAIKQLEEKCVAILEKKSKERSFPRLHHLLIKYYGLSNKT